MATTLEKRNIDIRGKHTSTRARHWSRCSRPRWRPCPREDVVVQLALLGEVKYG